MALDLIAEVLDAKPGDFGTATAAGGRGDEQQSLIAETDLTIAIARR